ncbi:hypothetical protein OBV_21840 [Oscillibacter valericigenes Sjm18-20]|nr:hypothetical protein OBV_21840 [Oscillibacter valericigenes Sjm18-20]
MQAQNYLKLETLLHRQAQISDPSYQAALYLLATNTELTNAAAPFISGNGIDFAGIKRAARGFDERTGQLVDVAHNLFSWNSKCAVTPFDLTRMGYPMLDRVCEALYIAVGQINVQVRDRETSAPRLELDDNAYRRTKKINRAIELMQKPSENEDGD